MEAKINAATTLMILLELSGIAVTGKVEGDITLERADSGSVDFEAITFDVEELSHGWYKLTIDANQLNTLGENLISVTCSGADTKYYSIDVVARLASDMRFARATAITDFLVPMFLAADHVSPGTGLAPAGVVSIDGGAPAALTNAMAEIGATGVYSVDLTAAELTATSSVALVFTGAGLDQVTFTLYVNT